MRKHYFFKAGFWGRCGRFILYLLIFAFGLVTLLTVIARFTIIHPVSTLMLGDYLTQTSYKRQWVPIKAMPFNLAYAVMMAEDARFCSHGGVDWQSLTEAATDDDLKPRGASTITMQLVKNLYLSNTRSYLRKGVELPLALWVDLLLPKKRILEIYLNIAEWGKNIYGAEAASRFYFGIPVRDLTLRQAALLAVSLPSPQRHNPHRLSENMLKRAAVIERRVLAAGPYIGCLR